MGHDIHPILRARLRRPRRQPDANSRLSRRQTLSPRRRVVERQFPCEHGLDLLVAGRLHLRAVAHQPRGAGPDAAGRRDVWERRQTAKRDERRWDRGRLLCECQCRRGGVEDGRQRDEPGLRTGEAEWYSVVPAVVVVFFLILSGVLVWRWNTKMTMTYEALEWMITITTYIQA